MIKDGLRDIEERWCTDDIVDAHRVLDAIEAAQARANSRPSRG